MVVCLISQFQFEVLVTKISSSSLVTPHHDRKGTKLIKGASARQATVSRKNIGSTGPGYKWRTP